MPQHHDVARSSAWLNVAIGSAGLAEPTVTGNDDRIIDLHAGHLLSLAAMNPPHALLHLGSARSAWPRRRTLAAVGHEGHPAVDRPRSGASGR